MIQNISAHDAEANTIIDKMIIDGYGGKENIMKLYNYKQVWDITPTMSDIKGTDYRSVHVPHTLVVKLVYPHKTEVRKLINGQGEKQYGKDIIKAKGPMLDAMKLQLIRLYNPIELKKRTLNIGVTEDNDNYILKLIVGTLNAKYFVSKKTYLITKVIGELRVGVKTMAFITHYEDYRNIDGVMVHHKEIKYAGNINTAVLELRAINFN